MTRSIKIIFGSLLTLACIPLSFANGLMPVRIESTVAMPLTATAPVLDGKLDDTVWQTAQPMQLTAYKTKGARYPTEAWIVRDAENFYIGARCHDDNLHGLITRHEGSMLWKNDCLEIFFVPEKNEFYWSKVMVDCDGKFTGSVWVPDEWGEAVEGEPLQVRAKPGREEAAWTIEIAIPIQSFGLEITKESVWAFGINREKQSAPAELASYQGGFNKPKEYPDLVFDGRSMVFDGVGVKNIGRAKKKVSLTVTSAKTVLKTWDTKVKPGKTVPVQWKKLLGDAAENAEFTVTVKANGQPEASETYRLIPAPKKRIKIDPDNLPEPDFRPGPLDDPDFFPIGVWLQPAPERVISTYKNIGVNVYFGGISSYPSPRGKDWLDNIHAAGMYAVLPIEQKYIDNELYKHPAVIGWHQPDEPELTHSDGSTIPPGVLMANLVQVRGLEVQMPVFLGFSQSVGNDRYVGHVVPYDVYPEYCRTADILGFDIYPCNSLGASGPDRFCVGAKGLDRLKQWSKDEKMLYFVVEANKFTKANVKDSRSPTAAEVQSQIWMAIVHEARMISLFCHSWAGPKMKAAGIESEMMDALKEIIGEIKPLAAVINSPTVENGALVKNTMGSRVDVLVKNHDGETYIFAANMYRKAERPEIRVKGVKSGVAEVLYENRNVPVQDGLLIDEFEPYGIHRYRIAK